MGRPPQESGAGVTCSGSALLQVRNSQELVTSSLLGAHLHGRDLGVARACHGLMPLPARPASCSIPALLPRLRRPWRSTLHALQATCMPQSCRTAVRATCACALHSSCACPRGHWPVALSQRPGCTCWPLWHRCACCCTPDVHACIQGWGAARTASSASNQHMGRFPGRHVVCTMRRPSAWLARLGPASCTSWLFALSEAAQTAHQGAPGGGRVCIVDDVILCSVLPVAPGEAVAPPGVQRRQAAPPGCIPAPPSPPTVHSLAAVLTRAGSGTHPHPTSISASAAPMQPCSAGLCVAVATFMRTRGAACCRTLHADGFRAWGGRAAGWARPVHGTLLERQLGRCRTCWAHAPH